MLQPEMIVNALVGSTFHACPARRLDTAAALQPGKVIAWLGDFDAV
jgi:hypothetical protein